MNKINYDLEPVWYCDTCLSLKILNSSGVEEDIDGDMTPCHCGDCGSTDVATGNIHDILEIKKIRKQFKKK